MNGIVGDISNLPRQYRCYILFIPNEMQLNGTAEQYLMRHFWEVASSVGNDVLFSGIVRGRGLVEARTKFGLSELVSSALLVFDVCPSDWVETQDPLVTIPLAGLKSEYDVFELLHLLVTVTKRENFIGRLKRKQTFDKAKELLQYLPTIGDMIKYAVPGA